MEPKPPIKAPTAHTPQALEPFASPYGEETDFLTTSSPLFESGTPSEPVMPLMDHLEELRARILIAAMALVVGTLFGFYVSHDVIRILQGLGAKSIQFVQLTPGEVFLVSMRVALITGVVTSAPVWLYQILRFILPGLLPPERRLVWMILSAGSVLFAAGVAFSYSILLPKTMAFLFFYGQDVATMQMSIQHYIQFCISFLFLCGLAFEFPLVLYGLVFMGLVHPTTLIKQWRTTLIGIFTFSAVFTPSQDPLTMCLLAGAMTALWVLSIFPLLLWSRHRDSLKAQGSPFHRNSDDLGPGTPSATPL